MSNPVKQLFHYFTGSLKELIDLSFVVKDRLVKKEICPVTEQLIADFMLKRYELGEKNLLWILYTNEKTINAPTQMDNHANFGFVYRFC